MNTITLIKSFSARVAMTLLLVIMPAYTAWADESGECGSGLTYTYEESTHILTISKTGSGTGAMTDYNQGKSPWYSHYLEIEKIVINSGVTYIGNNAFFCCQNNSLTSITIPEGVTAIGEGAFNGCLYLTSLSIPASVTSIGDNAFYDCSSLKNIILEPTTPPTIGNNMFYNCSLINILVSSDLLSTYVTADGWKEDGLRNLIRPFEGYCTFFNEVAWGLIDEDGDNTRETIIISGLKYDALMDNYNSTSDQPWEAIRDDIQKVVFTDNVTQIGAYAFANFHNLTTVVSSNITVIGSNAFSGCLFTDYTVPASVTLIDDYAFCSCGRLETLTFADGSNLQGIGNEAFSYCSKLTSLTIPSQVNSIGKGITIACYNLTSLTVAEGNSIYESPSGSNAIIEKASHTLIAGCKSTVIPDGVTTIGEKAFKYMLGLYSITIPDGVTTIGARAFEECENLLSITIPASVTSIYALAFNYCEDLEAVYVQRYDPSHVTPITAINPTCFDNCDKINIFVPAEAVNTYKTAEGWLWYCPNIGIFLSDTGYNNMVSVNNTVTDLSLLGRTLYKDGAWNSLCLPFSLSASQIAASPLAGASIMELDNASSGLSGTTLTLNFTDVTEIEAGKPYIIMWNSGDDIVNPRFSGVTISATTPDPVTTIDGKVTFVGNYSPFEINNGNIDEVIYLGSNNTVGYASAPRTLRSFRAHFEVPTGGASPAPIRQILFNDGTTTAIIPVTANAGKDFGADDDAWYSIHGIRLNGEPIERGLYINNGKKFIIK